MDVQCYELFGGIALKNHAFSFSFFISFSFHFSLTMRIKKTECSSGLLFPHLLSNPLNGKK